MTKIKIFEKIMDSAQNRRGLLKKLSVAGAAMAAGTTLSQKKLQAATPLPSDVVQFALNLEYLEAEFYSVAITGQTLEARGFDVSGMGTPGPTMTNYGAVNFANNFILTASAAQDIATDEMMHVAVLRQALLMNGITPIAKPAINLDALAAMGASLANEASFLTLGRIFEDIGLSAYAGAAPFLSGSPFLQTAARITGVEGEHVANIRLQMARLGITTPALDPADVIPPPSGSNFFSTNLANGLCAIRTPEQVLYLAYGNVSGASSGGFFPNGVNGAITVSDGPAPAANLDTNPPTTS